MHYAINKAKEQERKKKVKHNPPVQRLGTTYSVIQVAVLLCDVLMHVNSNLRPV